jgi:hypothetical protein
VAKSRYAEDATNDAKANPNYKPGQICGNVWWHQRTGCGKQKHFRAARSGNERCKVYVMANTARCGLAARSGNRCAVFIFRGIKKYPLKLSHPFTLQSARRNH